MASTCSNFTCIRVPAFYHEAVSPKLTQRRVDNGFYRDAFDVLESEDSDPLWAEP